MLREKQERGIPALQSVPGCMLGLVTLAKGHEVHIVGKGRLTIV